MSMFASIDAAAIPFKVGQRVEVYQGTLNGEPVQYVVRRTEQSNPVSDVLRAFRADAATGDIVPIVEEWLCALHAYEAFSGYTAWIVPSHRFHALATCTPAEAEHALKVLSLLSVMRWLAVTA